MTGHDEYEECPFEKLPSALGPRGDGILKLLHDGPAVYWCVPRTDDWLVVKAELEKNYGKWLAVASGARRDGKIVVDCVYVLSTLAPPVQGAFKLGNLQAMWLAFMFLDSFGLENMELSTGWQAELDAILDDGNEISDG